MVLTLLKEENGLSPMLREFRSLVENNNIKSVAFVGSIGVCQPFAELFGYAVRNKECYFIPGGDLNNTKKLIIKDIGMQMEDFGDLRDIDAVVLFGGLAMPKYGTDICMIKELIQKLSPKKIVGICFMGIFKNAGWDKEIDFDYLIDGYIKLNVYCKEIKD
ncbi:DUF2124 family protein [Methanothermococcus okinawensis]|uniref:Uncharacterized conserved protein UCP004962 n=1 Tax=Methanothermococcus okinawensis (strain DSM 14208 / JCM 11175 / IH1) TaxID=647113 RepID=F8ANM2_METOI|nr:DUF2124 family protein [Methanothermococcus okinawensis]AEH07080.1 Uncharacterized conserved protein UCP004962 [Methanothermococcus okinawensis IH1]